MRVLTCWLVLTITTSAWAVPTTLSQTGRLTGPDGLPLDGTHTLRFSLHDDATGGATVWSEAQDAAFTDGVYTVVLGQASPLATETLAQDGLWLELNIDGVDLAPRQALTSAPYARLAGAAERLTDGLDWSELHGVPTDLADGDATLSPAEVDTIVADNGYAQDTDLLDLRAEVTTLGGDLDTLALEVLAGSAALDALALTCDGLTADVDDLRGRITVLEDGALSIDESLRALASRVATLEARGDEDTLAGLACDDGEIPRWDTVLGAWACSAETVVTEADVAAWVSDDGYAREADLLALRAATTSAAGTLDALTLTCEDLTTGLSTLTTRVDADLATLDAGVSALEARADLNDGVVATIEAAVSDLAASTTSAWDALAAEVTALGEDVSSLAPLAFSGDWSDLDGVPADLDDGDDDILAGLACDDGEVPTYNATSRLWVCGSGPAPTAAVVLAHTRDTTTGVLYATGRTVTLHNGSVTLPRDPTSASGSCVVTDDSRAWCLGSLASTGGPGLREISGTWSRALYDTYLLDTSGGIYQIHPTTLVATRSTLWTSTGYQHLSGSGMTSTSGVVKGCVVTAAGSLSCYGLRTDTNIPSGSTFTRVLYHRSTTTTEFVCGLTAAGTVSCSSGRWFGTLSGSDYARVDGISYLDNVLLCGVTRSGSVRCKRGIGATLSATEFSPFPTSDYEDVAVEESSNARVCASTATGRRDCVLVD